MKSILFKIKNIAILSMCFIYSFIRVKSEKNKIPKNIIIFSMGKLGDMVCITPLLSAIKSKYKDTNIFICASGGLQGLLKDHPYVYKYILYNKKSIFENVNNIKSLNIDFGITVTPDFNALAIMYLSGIKNITVPRVVSGYSPYETKSYKALSNLVNTQTHVMGKYAPREYLKLLQDIDIYSDETKKYLSFSRDEDEKVKVFFKNNNINIGQDIVVIVSHSVGNKIKTWGIEKFTELIKKINTTFKVKIILIGEEKDRVYGDDIKGVVPEVINSCGLFNIGELKSLISHSSLFISVDTGPIYIAEAFDIPTVDIIGPMDENEQPPRSNKNILIIPKREKSQLHIMNARVYDKDEALRQIQSITVDEVYTAVVNLFKHGIIRPNNNFIYEK
jgi:ADP-heptose:LPS heptosyltransferase